VSPVLKSTPTPVSGLVRGARSSGVLRGETLETGMKVGLFGGTFDPPHAGHLHVARTAMRRLGLDRIWWLVSPQNPLKRRTADDLERRMAAVRTLANEPGMVVTDIESRLGIRHTAKLLRAITALHPRNPFVWIMGADNLASIHRWHDWTEIVETVPLAVIARPQDPVRARLSLMASRYRTSRLREADAKVLPLKMAPAWTYLIEPLQSDSSTQLRTER